MFVAAFAQHGADGLVDTFADGVASRVVATGSQVRDVQIRINFHDNARYELWCRVAAQG